MKISVITPSYNYGQYLPTAVESALGDPRNSTIPTEQIIMDGGSTDGTTAFLKDCPHPHLTWRSEPDQGQSDALNKALNLASGDIVGWLNADDFYLPGALASVAQAFSEDSHLDVLIGDTLLVDATGRLIRLFRSYSPPRSIVAYRAHSATLMSTSLFFRRDVLGEAPFDTRLRRVMDWDLYLHLLAQPDVTFGYLRRPLGAFRFHDEQVTHAPPPLSGGVPLEHRLIYDKHGITPRRARLLHPLANAGHKLSKLSRGHLGDESRSRRLAGMRLLGEDARVITAHYDSIVDRSYRRPSSGGY